MDIRRFSLNRIVCPTLGLEDFFALAAGIGIGKVELRNDLAGGKVTDGIPPLRAAEMAERHGIRIISINALQRFNLASWRAEAASELECLLDLATALHCPAVVLCPLNDPGDTRSASVRLRETTEALATFGPAFTSRGLLGYVEPLGFAECSLPSLVSAAEAIRASGCSCYRTVFDTFHHFLGPDTPEDAGAASTMCPVGLIHASGVESPVPKNSFRDEHRVLVGPRDRTGCREAIRHLIGQGYTGDISLEPFSPEIQRMKPDTLASAVRTCIDYLRG